MSVDIPSANLGPLGLWLLFGIFPGGALGYRIPPPRGCPVGMPGSNNGLQRDNPCATVLARRPRLMPNVPMEHPSVASAINLDGGLVNEENLLNPFVEFSARARSGAATDAHYCRATDVSSHE